MIKNFEIEHDMCRRIFGKRRAATYNGFTLRVRQKEKGKYIEAFKIEGYVDANGDLTLTVDAMGGTRLKRRTTP